MIKNMKSHWKRAVSGLLAMVMMVGMLPASAFAADTGGSSNPYAPTYNFPGTYKITYRVNGGEPRTLADNLSTGKCYTLAASATALGLASNERVTEVMFVFGQAPGGFAQVEKPMLYCTAVKGISTTSFVNVADVGGVYNGQWVQAISRWVTRVYGKPVIPTLPRTGY